MESSGGAHDDFEVSSAAATAAENPAFEGANVCRVAALSTMLAGNRAAIRDVTPELEALGFLHQLASAEELWGDVDPMESFAGLQDRGTNVDDRGRVWRWQMVGETSRPDAAVAFLVSVLGSSLERESAAAAAALWRQIADIDPRRFSRGRPWFHLWDRLLDVLEGDEADLPLWGLPWFGRGHFALGGPAEDAEPIAWDPGRWGLLYARAMSRLGDRYGDILVISMLTQWRLERALRSPDPITRSLATAAFTPSAPSGTRNAVRVPDPADATPPGALVVSTMIHGTWGWKGDWWRPRGDFHEFVLRNHRPNLYSRGAKFSWSGAYLDGHREQAAIDFCEWAYDVAPNGLQTVFAHSYGGEVGARAVLRGARVNELVLLSAPVTGYVEAAAQTVPRVVDVRLSFDPVLALAQTRQRMTPSPNVTSVILNRWRLDHAATHTEQLWREEDVARRGRL